MMVNQVNNNLVPWQNTVPQQMPWMSTYQAAPLPLQFGQQGVPIGADNMLLPNSQLLLGQQHPSLPNQLNVTDTNLVCAPLFDPQMCQPISPTITDTTSSQGPSMLTSYVTETLQQNSHPSNLPNPIVGAQSATQNISNSNLDCFNLVTSLTQLPNPSNDNCERNKKKRTFGDFMSTPEFDRLERPAKQLLSERKLFKKFGSLQLDANLGSNSNNDSDDSEEDDRSQATMSADEIEGEKLARKELDRYVYLLFKDKKGNDTKFSPTTTTLDRLAREERDKLSKAVILWNPPPKVNFFGVTDDDKDQDDEEDDEESFSYKDHTDFLKTKFNTNNGDGSIIITEVTCDEPCNSASSAPTTCIDADTEMFE